ncbi:Glu/Leu/Phe/Val dehydrogenase dimerization domain-containing protein [Candidatus Electronema sp. JM]|uniref:Glu/Leu/Phe/Val dehydrogenase dimerization domain-containing protein n=1 Tax=Candidatus Electronema sp. JM TaxID=3401571 RepID=UPI003AA93E11
MKKPELIVEYTDPLEGFKGWLAIDSLTHRMAAGGMRVQRGLTREVVGDLAATMTLKMRIAGIRADGAKCGIDYDPASPNKQEAMLRFIRAIKPYLLERYSMGPDLNTTMPELDEVCARIGISSIKAVIATCQEFTPAEFEERVRLLKRPVGHATLGKLRSGAGVAASCLAVLEFLQIPAAEAKVVIQGFGSLASSAAYFLHQAGVPIIGLADCEKSLISEDGAPLDIADLLDRVCADCTCQAKGLIPKEAAVGCYGSRKEIYSLPCDVFIPAAIERAIDRQAAETMQIKAVVAGANLAVTDEAEAILHQRGIIVIPDMVAGCGGSLSMQGLFGPEEPPSAQDVLRHVDRKTRSIIRNLLERSHRDSISPREAALRICAEAPLHPDTKPYGGLGS